MKPDRQAAAPGARAVFEECRGLGAGGRQEEAVGLAVVQRRPVQEWHDLVENGDSAVDLDVMGDAVA